MELVNLMLNPSQNTYISSKKPDENYACSSIAYIGLNPQKALFRALLHFDLSMLPSDILIESAIVRMYADPVSDRTSPGLFTPYIVTSNWSEGDVIWDNQPEINTSIAGKTMEVSTYGWYNWDIINIVQVWLMGSDNNYGLMIKSQEDEANSDVKKFHSMRSYYYRNYRPALEIRYKYKNAFTLGARNTTNVCETLKTCEIESFTTWQNTSIYSMYTFFVQNIGQHPACVRVQISPDRVATFNEAAEYLIPPGAVEAIVTQRYGFFSRLACKSSFYSRTTLLKVWFQAQV